MFCFSSREESYKTPQNSIVTNKALEKLSPSLLPVAHESDRRTKHQHTCISQIPGLCAERSVAGAGKLSTCLFACYMYLVILLSKITSRNKKWAWCTLKKVPGHQEASQGSKAVITCEGAKLQALNYTQICHGYQSDSLSVWRYELLGVPGTANRGFGVVHLEPCE